MSTPVDFTDKLKSLPEQAGIYQFLDQQGKIIYVGKAKNLKKRVSSYFNKQQESGKTRVMVKLIRDLNYLVVSSEYDALLLENNLIKEHQPRYNILLKDDKTYPWICIKAEAFPRVFMTRRMIRDGSAYFGPYPSVVVVKTLLNFIRELYPLRTCSLDLRPEKIEKANYRTCLEYHLGNCKAPCIGEESIDRYESYLNEIEHILRGNLSQVLRSLRQKMNEHARALEFEAAQQIKDRIQLIERYQAKSTIVSPSVHHTDVITVLHDENRAFVNYLRIQKGAIVNGITVEVSKKLDEDTETIIGHVLPEMRQRFGSKSREVLVDALPTFDIEGLRFVIPKIGDKKALLDLSRRNTAAYKLEKIKHERIVDPEKHTQRVLEQIRHDFRLKELPVHMECFDNSNLQGNHAVSACVVFKNAKPSKSDYRHFNIKTVTGPDDFASMEEVVFRRYKRMLEEGQSLPQLIIIDGGKGQLSAALNALNKLGLSTKVGIVGIAKRLEEIFFPGSSEPLYIDKRSESLKTIQYMRNEAHRFGITHHRAKRSKAALNSEIMEIPGIGEKSFEALMKKMKTVERIRKASIDELTEVLGRSKALQVHGYFISKA